MAFDLVAELFVIVDRFERERIDYAICGGLALALHGHARATMDIDLLVPQEAVDRALAAAKALGFDVPAGKMTFGLGEGKPRTVHRVSKIDEASGELLSLDLLVVGPDLEAVWIDRVPMEARSVKFVVVSRAGLATMKRIASRPQDLLDLAVLESSGDDKKT